MHNIQLEAIAETLPTTVDQTIRKDVRAKPHDLGDAFHVVRSLRRHRMPLNWLIYLDAVRVNSDKSPAISIDNLENIAFLCFILAFCDAADHHSTRVKGQPIGRRTKAKMSFAEVEREAADSPPHPLIDFPLSASILLNF
jgi:hypothetical protein